jgi:hypothetical protein
VIFQNHRSDQQLVYKCGNQSGFRVIRANLGVFSTLIFWVILLQSADEEQQKGQKWHHLSILNFFVHFLCFWGIMIFINML